ncbi:MAG TPA: hypothetical protein VFJ16_21925 [Longimicrobium sp.]|nr:hypothetical protein [Longimicrobium sp.]
MSPVPWNRPAGTPAPRTRHGTRRAARALAALLAVGVPALAVAQGKPNCPAPVVPASLVKQGAAWEPLQQFMATNAIAFPNGQTATVIPCPKGEDATCLPMRGFVAAETRAACIDSVMINDPNTIRFVGMVQRDTGWKAANLGFADANSTGIVYLLVQGNQSLAVAQYNDSVHAIPQKVGNSWNFVFHPERGSFSGSWGMWRPDTIPASGPGAAMAMRAGPAVRHGGPSALMDEDDGVGPLNYNAGAVQMIDPAFAWMTCAAGCCQFHGSPPDGGGGGPNPPHGPPGPPGRPGGRPRP